MIPGVVRLNCERIHETAQCGSSFLRPQNGHKTRCSLVFSQKSELIVGLAQVGCYVVEWQQH